MGGFAIYLLLVFILLPITVIALIIWLTSRKAIILKTIGLIWLLLIGFIVLVSIYTSIANAKTLTRADIYGTYIIDRTKYPGKQADWQYEHYRFEITKQNDFIFHVTDKEKILKTYKGKMSFLNQREEPRLVVHVDSPKHHIIEEKPSLYRTTWSFYYVFKSPAFGNVFFKKGQWKPIEK